MFHCNTECSRPSSILEYENGINRGTFLSTDSSILEFKLVIEDIKGADERAWRGSGGSVTFEDFL